MKSRFTLEWFFCVFVPFAFFAMSVFVEKGLGYRCFTACEDGPIENLQAFVCLCAFLMGLSFWFKTKGIYPGWARAFFMVGILGALYAGLEEISYGQRIFGWNTPESWGLVNDQQETNLHNTSAWLDQKPRSLLAIGTVVGGIIIPALRKWKPSWLPVKFEMIYPSSAIVFTACFAIFVYAYRGIVDALGVPGLFVIERGSEEQEIYLYWFIFLYFWLKNSELKSM